MDCVRAAHSYVASPVVERGKGGTYRLHDDWHRLPAAAADACPLYGGDGAGGVLAEAARQVVVCISVAASDAFLFGERDAPSWSAEARFVITVVPKHKLFIGKCVVHLDLLVNVGAALSLVGAHDEREI